MKFTIKNLSYQGTRFFILQNLENPGIGLNTVGSLESDPVNTILAEDKVSIVKSLQECELELKFTESIIKSEIRFRLLGWN